MICVAEPVPDALLALTEKVIDIGRDLLTVHVAPVRPAQVPPVQTYPLPFGPLLQFAVIVVDCPTEGDAGLAVGAQTGTPPPAVMQVTVWFGGVPDTAKLLQFEFV